MATTAQPVTAICLAARGAARRLATLDAGTKDAALHAIADALDARRAEILEANERDLQAGRENDIGGALLDRLALNDARIDEMAEGVRTIAALDDPVGEVIEEFDLPAGPHAEEVPVP